MNTKEIGEIRRHLRRDRSNITAIYGCYVNDAHQIVSESRLSTGMMPENEGGEVFCYSPPVPVRHPGEESH